jgi:hypothetical protein
LFYRRAVGWGSSSSLRRIVAPPGREGHLCPA